MTDPSGVLARIDSTIDDWESSPDAARWSPDAPDPQPQYVGLLATLDGESPLAAAECTRMWIGDHEVPITGATWTEVRMETRPAPWLGAQAIRMASEYQRQTGMLFEGQLLASALEAHGLLGRFMAVITDACESVVALSRALRLEPWPHGWNEPCFCHPKPLPAARDYRRRTKHRNRRRR
jgi:hypothetical protein